MNLPFVKMHGIGNDFVMVDLYERPESGLLELARENAVLLCDRKFGIGADGVIAVLPGRSGTSDFQMVMYNPDGSESEMCGNGIRCFAKLAYERDYTKSLEQRIMTGRGELITRISLVNDRVESVEVDMGAPILARRDIPTALPGDPEAPVINEPLDVDGVTYHVTCVSMGNPHCIVFVDDVDQLPLSVIGPKFERHPCFPKRINTEFIQIISSGEFKMRVWERGAGETLACGTGACASAVACHLNGFTGREVIGHLAGGDLKLNWIEGGSVLMTGSATEVFQGVIDLP